MTRPVLDPDGAPCNALRTVHYRLLNKRIRSFGYTPDEAAMEPADLVLVADSGAKGSAAISEAQRRGGFGAQHARWTHVAMYIGDDRVVEASPTDGVRVNALSSVLFRRVALVRRVEKPTLSLEARYRVIIHAMHELGQPYSLGVVPELAWWALRGRWWRRPSRSDDQALTICSSFVRRTYLSATNINIAPQAINLTWPADLSISERLVDVPVGWVRVSP